MSSTRQTTRTTLTIDQIEISPFNVRTNQEDVGPSPSMEQSILAFGLIHELVVHPMRGRKNKWGAHIGYRRYRSIKALIDRGELGSDWPIDVKIRDGYTDAELLEESQTENLQRKDLRPYEIFEGSAKAFRRGDDPNLIAKRTGQSVRTIKRWIRIGSLPRVIFDALEAELITVDEAQAYGATEDKALQLATFAEMQPRDPRMRTAAHIREHMRVGDREEARLLQFVGIETYIDKGGSFELDLFADDADQRGRVEDVGILRKLVDAKLGDFKATIRARLGRDIRFAPEPPQSSLGTDYTLHVIPQVGEDDAIVIPAGDIIATIAIAESGEPEISYWWRDRKAKHDATAAKPQGSVVERRLGKAIGSAIATGTAAGGNEGRTAADTAIKQEEGLSQESIQIFRSVRRVIMQAIFVQSAREKKTVALDYLIWSQLRLALTGERISRIGMGILGGASGDPETAREHIRCTEAWNVWSQALYDLQRETFLTADDLEAAFLDYRAASAEVKDMAAAVVAALALERSLNFDGYQLPLHDAVTREMKAAHDQNIRHYWTPTRELLERVPAKQRLAIVEPYLENVTYGEWQRLKSGAELTKRIVDVVTGKGIAGRLRMSMQIAACQWVHPLLKFGPSEPAAAPIGADPELHEAAE